MSDSTESAPARERIITQEAQDRWSSLPLDRPISFPITVRELDRLFLAIRETIIAQSDLGSSMLSLSNQDVATAQTAFNASREHLDNALGHIDQLIVHAMLTAEPL